MERKSSTERQGRSDVERIWAQRAAQMARVESQSDPLGEQVKAVLLCLGRELLGLDVQYVYDIRQCGGLTRVPGVPAWVAGVINLRGNILPVIDLRKYFGLPAEIDDPRGDDDRMLVYVQANLEEAGHSHKASPGQRVHNGSTEIVFLVDEVLIMEILTVRPTAADSNLIHRLPPKYVRAIAERRQSSLGLDMWAAQKYVAILDTEALLTDPRLRVHQEVA